VPDPVSRPFADLLLRDFLGRLASGEPVPGGGSASAVAGSLGGALVAMVATLSQDRPKYAAHAELHAAAGPAGHRLAQRLLTIADEDAAAYAAYAAALKLPRETDEERAARSAAIRAAADGAAGVPLRCVEACLDVVTVAEALAGRSNANAASDLGVAALLAEAAAHGAAENVRVNLPSIGDEARAADLADRVARLVVRVAATAAETIAAAARAEPRDPVPADHTEAIARLCTEEPVAGGAA